MDIRCFHIPLRLENPKIGRVDDAEIVSNRIAEDGPVFRHIVDPDRLSGGRRSARQRRLPELATELVRRHASVIVTPAGTVATLAVKRATPTIPIIFGSENDPLQVGLVASFNRPEGNLTGAYFLSGGLTEKRLGLIRELLPRADLVGVLLNPNDPLTDAITSDVRQAASVVGQRIEVLHASNSREIDAAFASLVRKRASATPVCSCSSPFRLRLTTLSR
jgi:ABC-type uncharacterized transport system substrate-binding protein